MKQEDIFETITLMDGRKCSILRMKAGHYYMAALKFQLAENNKHPQEAYLIREVLIIDGKKRNLEYIDELSIDDFIAINEVLTTIMAKIPNING